MPAEPTKVYPLRGRFVNGVPHVVTETATKKEADELVASGAFTDNPRHPDRLDPEEAAPESPAPDKE